MQESVIDLPTETGAGSGRPASPSFVVGIRRIFSAPQSTIWALMALNLCLTLPLAYALNIWVDEAFSLHTTAGSIGNAFRQALHFELQAPLYFVLLDIWRKVDGSLFFARLFSVLCITATMPVLARLSRRLFPTLHPGWLLLIFALHPYTLWAATEIRLYPLAILISASLMLLFLEAYILPEGKPWLKALYLGLSAAALYTQYYLGFILVANALALLALRRWRPLRDYLFGMVLVAVMFSPMLLKVKEQVSGHTQTATERIGFGRAARNTSWEIKGFILPAEEGTKSEVARRWILRGTYAVLAIGLVLFRRRFVTQQTIYTIVVVITLSVFFTATLMLTAEGMVLSRHMATLFLPSLLLPFAFSTAFRNRLVTSALVLVMAVFCLFGDFMAFRPLAKFGDWQRVAAYLHKEEKANQSILVFHAGAALPLSEYYKGKNVLTPIPRDNNFASFDFRQYVLNDDQEIVHAVERGPGNHDDVWLVTDGQCKFLGVDYNCPVLEHFVESHYDVVSTAVFYRSTVRLLHKKRGGADQ